MPKLNYNSGILLCFRIIRLPGKPSWFGGSFACINPSAASLVTYRFCYRFVNIFKSVHDPGDFDFLQLLFYEKDFDFGRRFGSFVFI